MSFLSFKLFGGSLDWMSCFNRFRIMGVYLHALVVGDSLTVSTFSQRILRFSEGNVQESSLSYLALSGGAVRVYTVQDAGEWTFGGCVMWFGGK